MATFLDIVRNYLFIQFCILLFIAPFYLFYKYRHPEFSYKDLLKNSHIEEFFGSQQANWMVFFWAAGEAVCWFVIPEFLLLLIIFLRVKNKRKLLTYDILGTIFGTLVGLFLALHTNFDVTKVPYITQNMVLQTNAWYHALGNAALLFQPFSGIPYKVFVVTVHSYNVNLIGFFVLAILARMARYYIFYLLFVALFPLIHRFVSKHYIPIFVISCIVFSLLLRDIYQAYGPQYVVKTQGDGVIGAKIFSLGSRF